MDLTPVVMLLLRDVRHAERSTERHGVADDLEGQPKRGLSAELLEVVR